MGHPLDHRRSAMGGTRLHVYGSRDLSVAAISSTTTAMMSHYMIPHCRETTHTLPAILVFHTYTKPCIVKCHITCRSSCLLH